MHRLQWNDLQFVQAVIRHGSLSAAARALSVNHATVQRRISTVEASYRVQLFERLPGGYRLRPEGRDVLDALARIETEANRIERAFRGVRRSIEGTFRLTTTDTIAALLLPPHLKALRDTHPEAHVELAITHHRLDMSQPFAEIAIRPIHQLPENMSGEQAGHLQFRVFGSPDYLSVHTDTDVAAHAWLGVTPALGRSPAGQWQAEHLTAPPLLTADSFFPLAAMAEAGMGLAMLPVFVGRAYDGLVEAPQFAETLKIPFWIAAHRDLRSLESINEMIAYLAGALSSDPVLAP